MIPFGQGRDRFRRRRGGPGDRGKLSDLHGSSADDMQAPDGDWGGRLRGPEDVSVPALFGTGLPGRLREFPERSPSKARRRPGVRAGWFVAPLMLAATATGVLFVMRGPDQVFGFAFGLVVAVGILWILVSSLFPAKADRTCPQCGATSLERLDRHSTQGLTCRLCSWSDASASSFLLAEDEGALEDIVLRQRRSGESRR